MPAGVNYVNYLQSSGTQYFDADFKPNQDTRVVMCAEYIPQSNTTDYPIFGARLASGSVDFSLWNVDNSNTWQSGYGNEKTRADSEDVTVKRVYDKNKNLFYVDDTLLVTHTVASFQSDYSLFLFACNNAGTVSSEAFIKLYYCQVYDNEALVRDFWPCYDPDGVACLYDKVSKAYFYNAGSGEFAAG